MQTTRRPIRKAGIAIATLALTVGLAACGSTSQTTTSTTQTTTPAATAGTASPTQSPPGSAPAPSGTVTGTGDFCAVFTSLNPSKDEAKGGPSTPEGWAKRLDTVERAAALAPPEIEPQADTYVRMIKDRTALAARYDYGQVPADAMQSFIASHREMQQQVNQLLSYVRQTCGGIGAAETGGTTP